MGKTILPLFLLWSCAGSSVTGGRVDSGPVAHADFGERAASAICGNIGGCCEDGGFGFDRAACDTYVRTVFDRDERPNTVWDSAAAGRCIDYYTEVATSCVVSQDQLEGSCDRLDHGVVPAGGDCQDDFECADIRGERAICFYDGTTVSGRCEAAIPPMRARRGDPCNTSCSGDCGSFPADPTTAACFLDDGVVCDFNVGVCVSVPGVGEPCPAYACLAGAYCDYLDLVCKAKKTAGASCEQGDECSIDTCRDGVCGPGSVASEEICLGQIEP